MNEYKQIKNILKVINASLSDGHDPLLAYLIGMASEHCSERLKAETRGKTALSA